MSRAPDEVQSHAAPPVTVIAPGRGWCALDLPDLWRHRHLLWILASRDIKVRYKQTLIGVAWAILQPLLTMVVFTTLFKLMGQVPATEAMPYAVSTYCALLPWQLFATSVTQSTESLVMNQNLVTKAYFPRVIIPLAPILAALFDFAIALTVLLGMMAWYGIAPGIGLLAAPLLVALATLTAAALGLWLSALNALYRDIRYAVPFAVQIGMFLSPVVYETAALVPERWHFVYSLNPMVGVVEGFRWAMLGRAAPPVQPMLLSVVIVAALLASGALYFRRVERTIADRV